MNISTYIFALYLSNFLFISRIDNNKIILNNYDINNSVIIKYEYIYQNNEYDKQNIIFNYSLEGSHTYFDYVKTIMKTDDTYLQVTNSMVYNISNCNNNYLNVSIYIKNLKQNDDNLILVLSVNKPVNYDGSHYLEINDYIIIFSETAYVERFGNYFYIHFKNKRKIYYNFLIKYHTI